MVDWLALLYCNTILKGGLATLKKISYTKEKERLKSPSINIKEPKGYFINTYDAFNVKSAY